MSKEEYIVERDENGNFQFGDNLIRCKDCKYFSNETFGDVHPCYKGGYFKEDGYCSRGERRENG